MEHTYNIDIRHETDTLKIRALPEKIKKTIPISGPYEIIKTLIIITSTRKTRAKILAQNLEASEGPTLVSLDGKHYTLLNTGEEEEIGTVDLEPGDNTRTLYIIPLVYPFPDTESNIFLKITALETT